MPATRTPQRRRAFTLIELLVAISLIILLAALGAAFLPKLQDNQKRIRAVDQLSQWLLIAKQRAKRDGLPTGVRILVDNSDPNNPKATQVQYVQQPDTLAGGSVVFSGGNATLNGGMCTGIANGTATFAGVDFTGGATTPALYLVQPGDYLEIQGGGSVHLITAVPSGTTLQLANTAVTIPAPTTNYRILRQPRPLTGEDTLTLPADMAISFSTNPGTSQPFSQNVPVRTVAGLGLTYMEIVFSPTGSVIGQGTQGGKIYLWVYDTTLGQMDPGGAAIVSVQVRSGYIAAFPINPNNPADPYTFAEDGRSSGM